MFFKYSDDSDTGYSGAEGSLYNFRHFVSLNKYEGSMLFLDFDQNLIQNPN